jgi:hypothetical protein
MIFYGDLLKILCSKKKVKTRENFFLKISKWFFWYSFPRVATVEQIQNDFQIRHQNVAFRGKPTFGGHLGLD